ncbi:unnamed protein product [Staurois parvus]|uniref:Uncharacterized protein n=1 Tax=Staurois parvus TaxID=386267 RepID=A0ABN9FWA7_9NEOB|nr:unnamed protein product [Staurois parvus]
MYVKWFDTEMLYYLILVYFSEYHFLSFSNFPPFHPPYVPTLAGNGTQMTDAGIPPDYIARDTAGGTLRERRTR